MSQPVEEKESILPVPPQAGVIRAVRGRALGRGVPEAHTLTIETSAGMSINAGLPWPEGTVPVKGRQVLGIVGPERFDRCPICGDTDATSRDHVPPEAVGGKLIVYTCARCNNTFGGRYEAAFQNWYNGSLGTMRVRGPGAPGSRVLGEVLLRRTDRGPDMLIPISDGDPAAWDIVKSGRGRVSVHRPNPADTRIASVKSAYLAACALLSDIPDSPRGVALRNELIAVRDTPRGTSPSVGRVSASLQIFRGPSEPTPGEVTLVHLPVWREHPYWISFNSSVFVEWPLELGLLVPFLKNALAESSLTSSIPED